MSQTRQTINVMVDLETLGLKPDAKVISIGAVVFDIEKDLGDEFYKEIDWENGSGTIDASTVKFWFSQAKKGNFPPLDSTTPEFIAVQGFWEFLSEVSGNFNKQVILWANGTDFDIPKIDRLFTHHHANEAFRYNAVRDYRTIAKVFGKYGLPPDKVDHHNAVADARWQARHLISILKNLKELGIEVNV